MTTPLHADEPDTSSKVVETLLRGQFPDLAGLPLAPLRNTGSDNALYRLGAQFVIRLPRFPDAARRLGVELDWLPRLHHLPVAVPTIVGAGVPEEAYPFSWAVLRWLDGMDAWEARHQDGWFGPKLGHDLAAVVQQLRDTAADDATWLRARGFALEQSIGGVISYTPRRHPLGAVMQRTLERLLAGR